ncbi:hypothetical protein [Helicobacter pylori]|uniref:hypothetical protein n=1 Tax=Helicobacter pylori TaxID=210 RepID=UPI0002290A5F|nr:hypothetical protein [Helicobacter pylori]AEN18658.1 hypothetical protein HPPN135_04875 [Helicobacter pylori Puno135]
MPPLKGILADRNDSNNPVCAFLMEPFQKTKFYPIVRFKASLLNICRKDWNFMGKLTNLF